MIQFTIDSSGRPYNSIKDAIQDGGYSVLGTARKKTLKGIAKTTSVML